MTNFPKYLTTTARYLLGAGFLTFGLNGFVHFMPTPPVPAAAGEFLGALGAAGYMFPLIKGTEVAAGVLLLANRFVPLALLLLAPVLVNIVAFHLFLAPAGSGLGLGLLTLELVLAWAYRDAWRPLFATGPVAVEPRRPAVLRSQAAGA